MGAAAPPMLQVVQLQVVQVRNLVFRRLGNEMPAGGPHQGAIEGIPIQPLSEQTLERLVTPVTVK